MFRQRSGCGSWRTHLQSDKKSIINEITVGAPFRVRDQTVVKSNDFGVNLTQVDRYGRYLSPRLVAWAAKGFEYWVCCDLIDAGMVALC